MNQPAVAPHIRKWFSGGKTKMGSGFYRARRNVRQMSGITFAVWLVALLAGALAVTMEDHHQRQKSADYRALPSADRRVLSADYPLTRTDTDAELTRMVEREWRRVEGKP